MLGRLAQLEERRPYKAKVAGSRPAAPTTSIRFSLRGGPAGATSVARLAQSGEAGNCLLARLELLLAIDAATSGRGAAERGLPMARITQVVVTCDLEDGDVTAAESLTFSFGGKTYTLDLCKKHLEEVKGALEGFANHGHSAGRGGRARRRAAPTGRAPRATRPAAAPRGESQAAIREWARAAGYAVGDRGRIPGEVRAAYDTAQSKGRRR